MTKDRILNKTLLHLQLLLILCSSSDSPFALTGLFQPLLCLIVCLIIGFFSHANSSPFKPLLSFMHSSSQLLPTPTPGSQLNYSLLRGTFFISITRSDSFIFSSPTTSTLFHPTYNFKCICVIIWFRLNPFMDCRAKKSMSILLCLIKISAWHIGQVQ